MKYESVTATNDVVYYISKISSSWELSNPYFLALRALLLCDDAFDLGDLRGQQHYLFIANIMQNTLKDSNELKNIRKKIGKRLEEYDTTRKEENGDLIIDSIFMLFLLKILNYKSQLEKISEEKIRMFLNTYKPIKSNYINIKKILCFLFGVDNNDDAIYINEYDVALNLMYLKLLLSKNVFRTEGILIDYYVKQRELEERIFDMGFSSERSKGRVLEIALVLKAVNGDGLYIPDIEKNQYLSTFAQELVRTKIESLYTEASHFEVKQFKIPFWFLPSFLFVFEAIIYSYPEIVDSISILFIELGIANIILIPFAFILLLNGAILSLFMYYVNYRVRKRISDKKWM